MKDIIVALAVPGLTFKTNLFVAEMPQEPFSDMSVTLYDAGGEPPSYYASGAVDDEKPAFTVYVRGAKGQYISAYSTIQAIKTALNGLANYTINSTRYLKILVHGDINALGFDANQRPELTLNFRTHRTPAS